MTADGPDSATPRATPPGPAAVADDQDEILTQRLVTLSDGVVAIALTLLILGIQVPAQSGLRDPDSASQLASALASTADGWVSYVISFYVIVQFWLMHRQVFRAIRGRLDGLAIWNFLFLFTISVMPFTSDLIGKYSENPLSVIIFSANLVLASLAMHGMLSFSRRRGLLNEQGAAVLERYSPLQGGISIFFYLLAVPVALVNPDLAKLCWLGLALAPRMTSLISKRRRAAAAKAPPLVRLRKQS